MLREQDKAGGMPALGVAAMDIGYWEAELPVCEEDCEPPPPFTDMESMTRGCSGFMLSCRHNVNCLQSPGAIYSNYFLRVGRVASREKIKIIANLI